MVALMGGGAELLCSCSAWEKGGREGEGRKKEKEKEKKKKGRGEKKREEREASARFAAAVGHARASAFGRLATSTRSEEKKEMLY